MKFRHLKTKQKMTGFTLFEVLIAVLVLSIGLLGLASLQVEGLKNNNSAYMRSQASILAYDLADRIRANPGPNYATTTAAAVSGCTTVTGCNTDEMAANDLFEWQAAIASALPSGSGTVTRDSSGSVYTITISWDDDRSGSASQSFATSFMP